jgi:hypothetical protein
MSHFHNVMMELVSAHPMSRSANTTLASCCGRFLLPS